MRVETPRLATSRIHRVRKQCQVSSRTPCASPQFVFSSSDKDTSPRRSSPIFLKSLEEIDFGVPFKTAISNQLKSAFNNRSVRSTSRKHRAPSKIPRGSDRLFSGCAQSGPTNVETLQGDRPHVSTGGPVLEPFSNTICYDVT